MIQEFSGGYYFTTMDVQKYQQGPVIEHGLYEFINKELYLDEDAPVMMRIGLNDGPIFSVKSESAVPRGVLAMPEDMIESTGTCEVFILKSQYADSVGDYHVG